MTKISLLALCVIIMLTVGYIGQHMGYTVDGVPQGDIAIDQPTGLLGQLDALVDSFKFIWHMSSFGIDGMPPLISLIFLLIDIMVVIVIFMIIRGV